MKPATIRDVARHARVSVASVSRALNGSDTVTEETRRRIIESAEALQYVPHSGARSLSTSKTNTLGIILPDLYGEFFSELIRGMDLAAREHGYHLIVSSSHDDADGAAAAIRSMRGRVDGLFVLSPQIDSANLATAMAGRLPVVLMHGGAAESALPSIVVDNNGGARAAVGHLLAGGCRNIAHIAGPAGNLEAEARLAGYLEAMAEAGLDPHVVEGDFNQGSGHASAQALMAAPRRFDGVFCGNDMMAIGALLAFQEAGVRCPEDVAVVGFDDVPIAALVRPGLTTMRIRIAETGRRALERLVGQIEAAQAGQHATASSAVCEVVRPELVIRSSARTTASTTRATDGRPSGVTASAQGENQDG